MKQFGLIGHPLTHSFSKKYFDDKFIKEHIQDASFSLWDIPNILELPQLISSLQNLKGIAVTIPYKKDVIPYLHWMNDAVKAIGACNCILVKDQKLFGYNTDILGFQLSFMEHFQPHHKQALILGAGGAAAGVEYVMQQLSIPYLNVSRNKGNERTILFEELNERIITEYPIIINCTPLGTYPNVDDCPALPYHLITPNHYFFDLVYNPAETMFLRNGKEHGATIKNGYDMLVLQAEENWRIWNN